MMARADAVIVATAPDSHVEIALDAVRLGIPVFIEKPLAHDRTGIDALIAVARANNSVVEVGCQLRHHPAARFMADALREARDGPVYTFQACVGQRLDQWRPGTDYPKGFSADATRGGGALFELVHELDLALWMLGPVSALQADLSTVGDLGIQADDIANLTLVLKSGGVGQVQLDMLSPTYRRRFEVVCRNAVWRFDYTAGRVTRADGEGEVILYQVPSDFDRNTMFLSHMKHFLRRATDATIEESCGLLDGVAVLDLALAARRAHSTGARIVV